MIIDDIRKSQLGDDTATLNLIEKFKPALKKYARKLETEDAYYDLQVEFLDLISHIDCTTLKTKMMEQWYSILSSQFTMLM